MALLLCWHHQSLPCARSLDGKCSSIDRTPVLHGSSWSSVEFENVFLDAVTHGFCIPTRTECYFWMSSYVYIKQSLLRDLFSSLKPEKQFLSIRLCWTECHSFTLVVNWIPLNVTQLNVSHVFESLCPLPNRTFIPLLLMPIDIYNLEWIIFTAVKYENSLHPSRKDADPFQWDCPEPLTLLLKKEVSEHSWHLPSTSSTM